MQDDGERKVVKRRRSQYFDKRQQLDLILEALLQRVAYAQARGKDVPGESNA